MNWQKANQALGNIERLIQVFELSKNFSSIERDLLLRRIQDLYEIVLESENSKPKTNSTSKVETTKPVVTPPPVYEKPKIELPKVEVKKIKPVIKIPKVAYQPIVIETPKVEVPKVEPKPIVVERPKVEKVKPKPIVVERPKVEKAKPKPVVIEKPKVEVRKPPVVETKTYQEPIISPTWTDEEVEIIDDLFEFKVATDLSEKLSAGPIRDLRTSMSINERFITISELFKGSKSKYDEAIQKLNNFENFEQATNYILDNLATKYGWLNKKKTKLAKSFIKKVRRRYL